MIEPDLGELSMVEADTQELGARCWGGGNRANKISQGFGHSSRQPHFFLLVRWHFRSEEPPLRTLRDEDTRGNKPRRMKLCLFLLLHRASPPALAISERMVFVPICLITDCTTCLKCLPLFCTPFKAQLQVCLSGKAFVPFPIQQQLFTSEFLL